MMLPLLSFTDGTIRVDLLRGGQGFVLADWTPGRPPLKGGGTWQSSPLADGRRLRDARYDNAIDTFEIRAEGFTQDALIEACQEADRLLIKGREYWATDWQHEPVWIEAKGPTETNVRYAIVHNYSFPNDDNPYAPPFSAAFGQREMEDLVLGVEHGHWQSRPPCGRDNMSEGAFRPEESADDAFTDDGGAGSINTVSAYTTLGTDAASDLCDIGIRFRSVTIPVGARVLSAYITFTSRSADAGDDCNALIVGERDSAPPSFAVDTFATFQARMTNATESVAWHQIEHWALGTAYNTPDLSPIIQEIIGLATWSSGNNLVIFAQTHNSSAPAVRRHPASWDNTDYPAAVLHVEWVTDADECYDCVPIGARQAYLNMEYDGPFVPEESADDKLVDIANTTGQTIATPTLLFGAATAFPNNASYGCGVRFRDVTVKQGATIVAAFVRYTSASNQAGTTCNATLDGEDAIPPAVFDDSAPDTGFTNYMTRVRTTASVAWNNVGAWVAGTAYDTPDISAVVQEIVNIPVWASGNNMVIFCDDNSSTLDAYREPAAWDNVGYDKPELWIDWWDEDGFHRGSFGTCKDQVYVANKHNRAQITHIFACDPGGSPEYSDNLVGTFECGKCVDLFINPPIGHMDMLFFGIDASLEDSGPFCSLVANIGTPAAYEGITPNDGIMWVYWNGANWVELTIQDNTNDSGAMASTYEGPFNTSGVNSVHWVPPTDWDNTLTIQGVTGWWIAAQVNLGSGGTISMPTQCDQEIYTVVWPYIETELARTDAFLPSVSADDAYVNQTLTTITAGGTALYFGITPILLETYHSGMRFRNAEIPRNAIILDAYLSFVAGSTQVFDNCNVIIGVEQDATPAAFTTYADFMARIGLWPAGTFVPWLAVERWTVGGTYRSPSFAEPLQRLMSLGGWESGNDVVVFVMEGASTPSAFREAAAWDHATYRPPMLCVTWIDPDMLGGDIAALDQVLIENQSYNSDTDLESDHIVCGLRSLNRGINYTPFINWADEQNPEGIVVSDAGANVAFINDIEAPSGEALQFTAAGILALGSQGYISLGITAAGIWHSIVNEYAGAYHCFVRYSVTTGTPAHLEARLTFACGSNMLATPIQSGVSANPWQTLDFGRVRLPPGANVRGDVLQTNFIQLHLGCTNAAGITVTFYDLILMPVDEWAAGFLDSRPTLETFAWFRRMQPGYELDAGSLSAPKLGLRAVVRDGNFQLVSEHDPLTGTYVCIANGDPILQANRTQRLWFLQFNERQQHSQGHSRPCISSLIHVNAVQRYLSMRGDR